MGWLTMTSTLTLLPPSPSPKLRYAAILDAGSSATRVYVYSWDASQGDDNIEKVTKVYPDEEALAKQKRGSLVFESTPG